MGKIIDRVRQRQRIAAINQQMAEWERRNAQALPGAVTYVLRTPETEPASRFLGISRFFFRKGVG
jgi:hypothetical protein